MDMTPISAAFAEDEISQNTEDSGVTVWQTNDARRQFENVLHAPTSPGIDMYHRTTPSIPLSARRRTAQQDGMIATQHGVPMTVTRSHLSARPDDSRVITEASQATSSIPSSHAIPDPASADYGEVIEPQRLPTSTHHKVIRHITILSLLTLAAIWGTLAREGLVALNTYSGTSVDPLIWPQAVGCLIMGLATGANRKPIEERYLPAYIMLTTGLCGCITTFSTWMLGVFRAFSNEQDYNRHGLHNVMDALSQTGLTFGMAIAGVAAGTLLSDVINLDRAIALFPSNSKKESNKEEDIGRGKISQPEQSLAVDLSMILLGAAFWAGAALLCRFHASYRHVTFGLTLAPFGAVLRWYLSQLNSTTFSERYSLPLGTLIANLLGTAVVCAAFTGSHAGSQPRSFFGGMTGCTALKGLADGFCGSLSTVSTFAVELRTIKPTTKAVRYAVVSWIAGVLICVILVGAPLWTVGTSGMCPGF
jgi:CrcB protein